MWSHTNNGLFLIINTTILLQLVFKIVNKCVAFSVIMQVLIVGQFLNKLISKLFTQFLFHIFSKCDKI